MSESNGEQVMISEELAQQVEVLGKDLVSWLEQPDGTRWTPAFETIEEWREWWERGGQQNRERALLVFESMAEAINAAGRAEPDSKDESAE